MGIFDFLKAKKSNEELPDLPPLDLPNTNTSINRNMYPAPQMNKAPNNLHNAQKADLNYATPPPFMPDSSLPNQQVPAQPTAGLGMPTPPTPIAANSPVIPPPPAPDLPSASQPNLESAPSAPESQISLLTEDVEKIAESIINDKWTKISDALNKVKEWKTDINNQVANLKESVDKLDKKLDETQKAILAKVNEYNASIGDVNAELKALGQVFEKIIPTFTTNVKELSNITAKLKKK